MKRLIIFPMILSIMFCSCAETPSEVDSEINAYNNASTVDNTNMQYDDIMNVLAQARDFADTNKTNITVENIVLPESTSMPVYEMKLECSDIDGTMEKLSASKSLHFEGGETVKIDNNIDQWKNSGNNIFTYEPSENAKVMYNKGQSIQCERGTYFGFNLAVTQTGIISRLPEWSSPDTMPPDTYTAQKRYYFGFDEITDSYTLFDGKEMTISQAASFAQSFADEVFASSEQSQFQYKADYIDVREIEKGKNGIYVLLTRCDKNGSRFDSTFAYKHDLTKDLPALLAQPVLVWITRTDYIAEAERHYALKLTSEKETGKLLTLQSAADKLSNTLAQSTIYSIKRASLRYVSEFKSSDYVKQAKQYYDSIDESKQFEVLVSPQAISAYGNYELEARPCWVFETCTGTGKETNCGTVYIIDALTGEIRIENESVRF